MNSNTYNRISYKAGGSTEKKERDRVAPIANSGEPSRFDLGGESRDEAWGATIENTSSSSEKLNISLQGLVEKEVERERVLNIKLQAALAEKEITVIRIKCLVPQAFVDFCFFSSSYFDCLHQSSISFSFLFHCL